MDSSYWNDFTKIATFNWLSEVPSANKNDEQSSQLYLAQEKREFIPETVEAAEEVIEELEGDELRSENVLMKKLPVLPLEGCRDCALNTCYKPFEMRIRELERKIKRNDEILRDMTKRYGEMLKEKSDLLERIPFFVPFVVPTTKTSEMRENAARSLLRRYFTEEVAAFFVMQLKCFKKNCYQYRWKEWEKSASMKIFVLDPALYGELRRNKFYLPAERTLKDFDSKLRRKEEGSEPSIEK